MLTPILKYDYNSEISKNNLKSLQIGQTTSLGPFLCNSLQWPLKESIVKLARGQYGHLNVYLFLALCLKISKSLWLYKRLKKSI